MSTLDLFRTFAALALLLGAAHVVGAAFARYRQPRVIGEIAGGLLLGPTVLGALAPGVTAWLFPANGAVASATQLVYQLGMVLLMFLAGVEMRSVFSRRDVRTMTVIAVVGMVVPVCVMLLLVRVVDLSIMAGPAGDTTALVLILACAVAITSIPVISRIMLDLGIMRTGFARVVLSVAVIEDVVLNVVIAVALGMVAHGGVDSFGAPALLGVASGAASAAYHAVAAVAFLGLVAGVAAAIRGRSRAVQTGHVATHLVLVLALCALCVFLGITPIFGAFAVGLIIGWGGDGADSAPVRAIHGVATGFFIPIYFAIVGLKLDLIAHFAPWLTLGFVAFACTTKLISVYGGARIVGTSAPGAINLAVALNARGGPGILLATLAYDAQIVNAEMFTTLILTAVVTSLLAGAWLERVLRRGEPLLGDADAVESGASRPVQKRS